MACMKTLCHCAVHNVGLKDCREKVVITQLCIDRFFEFLYDDT